MSYDILIIDPAIVPSDSHESFMEFYESMGEDETSTSPSDAIVACFHDLAKRYPSMDDPELNDEEFDNATTGYSFESGALFGAFLWSNAEDARQLCLATAHKNGLAFVDISDNCTIYFADGTKLAE